MESYAYTEIDATGSGIWLCSTDSESLERILTELRKSIPSLESRESSLLSSEDVYLLSLKRLQGQDVRVAFWILKQLCQQGWEPYEGGLNALGGNIRLRRCI